LKGDSLLLTELDLSANNLSGSSVITALAFCELSKLCLLIIIIIIIINFFLVGFVLFSVFFRASHIVASSFRAYKHDYVNNT
jgi:flagellar basal body-associated protein FliL